MIAMEDRMDDYRKQCVQNNNEVLYGSFPAVPGWACTVH